MVSWFGLFINISIFLIFLLYMGVIFFLFLVPSVSLSLCFFEWDFLSLKLGLYLGSVLFSVVLLIITASVTVYSSFYLSKDTYFDYYMMVLGIFVLSMFMLIYSVSCFTMLISWDLLGISSFFLVLFYNNWDSCSGAMNTVLTNRLGDYFLFVFFSSVLFSSYFFFSLTFFSGLIFVMLLLAGFTKSAQFPFSSWLPKAMSAPTPVSSLVHSSTLVTAGLVLIMNFGWALLSGSVMLIMFLIGLLTMCFSSVAALVEEDLKKVVALSTLSQMGFALLTLGLGLVFVSLVHLVSHALFKSCLFMQIGYIIHSSFGQQDGRGYFNVGNTPFYMQFQLLVTLFCLCGLFFTSGAVSKDYILEFMFCDVYSFMISMLFFFSVFLTFGYSWRLWKGMFLSSFVSNFHSSESFLYNWLSLPLVILSIFFLWWLSLNMFILPSMFLYVDLFVPLVYVVFIVFCFYLGLKFFVKEFSYKFIVDYVVKLSIKLVKTNKFMDSLLGSLNSKGYSMMMFDSVYSNLYMKNFYFNSVVIIVFLLCLFV